MVYISTQDRLSFIRFRQKYVSEFGHDKFKRLLKQAEKQLKPNNEEN